MSLIVTRIITIGEHSVASQCRLRSDQQIGSSPIKFNFALGSTSIRIIIVKCLQPFRNVYLEFSPLFVINSYRRRLYQQDGSLQQPQSCPMISTTSSLSEEASQASPSQRVSVPSSSSQLPNKSLPRPLQKPQNRSHRTQFTSTSQTLWPPSKSLQFPHTQLNPIPPRSFPAEPGLICRHWNVETYQRGQNTAFLRYASLGRNLLRKDRIRYRLSPRNSPYHHSRRLLH